MGVGNALELRLRRVNALPARAVQDESVRVRDGHAVAVELGHHLVEPLGRGVAHERQARARYLAEAALEFEMQENLAVKPLRDPIYQLQVFAGGKAKLQVGDRGSDPDGGQ